MKKSEIFDRIVDIVSEECEVRKELVLNDRRIHAVVEARCMCVHIMKKAGLTSDDIALIVLRHKRCGKGDAAYFPPIGEVKSKAKVIDDLYTSFHERYRNSKYFKLAYADVRKNVLREYGDVAKELEIESI